MSTLATDMKNAFIINSAKQINVYLSPFELPTIEHPVLKSNTNDYMILLFEKLGV